ncbi:serine hydrolase domain-containing protein [Corynebacterium heidelbergense]|nr:serine hydrolase domain-containing protein [Corynebacterium heidelbergense]WCZ37072.1 D-alanyl-D-alanine-carboxypeptidase/endopeptidase AmpH precursor [Corynebacterium heidelbergense]
MTISQFKTRRLIPLATALLLALAVLAACLWFGPRPVALASQNTGDPRLATMLREHAQKGHNELAAFGIRGNRTTFAGVGADAHTEVEIGSLTKMFTAELLRNQIAEGTVRLSTRVGEIHPLNAQMDSVTLEELARHRSGLPRIPQGDTLRLLTSAVTYDNPYGQLGRDEIFREVARAPLTGRGEEHYSNLGYALLGQLLAEKAGMTWEELVHRDILNPLHMRETYVATEPLRQGAPRGMTTGGLQAQPWALGGIAPAGGLRSTAADMAIFARHSLELGRAAQVSEAGGDNDKPLLGWVDGGDYWWHNGGTSGYSSMLIIDPRRQEASYVSANTSERVEDIAAAILGRTFK